MAWTNNYDNVHDTLAQLVTVPCVLNQGCASIGRSLDPASENADLAPETELEVPLWLGNYLAARHVVTEMLPKFYSQKVERKLSAGYGCVDLHIRCPYFYTAAFALNEVAGDERLARFMSNTFKGRFKELLTKAHTISSTQATTEITQRLTNEEAYIFQAGRVSVTAFEAWRYGTGTNAAAAASAGGSKRKRDADRQ